MQIGLRPHSHRRWTQALSITFFVLLTVILSLVFTIIINWIFTIFSDKLLRISFRSYGGKSIKTATTVSILSSPWFSFLILALISLWSLYVMYVLLRSFSFNIVSLQATCHTIGERRRRGTASKESMMISMSIACLRVYDTASHVLRNILHVSCLLCSKNYMLFSLLLEPY